jgi:hypothetical protein
MICLGFYQNEVEMLKLVEPLIGLLDGSNDFHSPEDEATYNAYIQKLEE